MLEPRRERWTGGDLGLFVLVLALVCARCLADEADVDPPAPKARPAGGWRP